MPPIVASLVARDLILAARDEHPSFDERRHPKDGLLRALSRYQRRLVAKIIRINEKFMVAEQETVLPLADFEAGIEVPDYKFPAGAEVEHGITPVRTTPLNFVPWEQRHRYVNGLYLRNNRLYLTGTASDWSGFTLLRFFYMPELDALTKVSGDEGTLVVPNAAEPCLVAYLVSFMAQRGHKDPEMEQPDKAGFKREWERLEQEFLDELDEHGQAEVSTVHEVF